MIINFDEIPQTINKQFKGGKGETKTRLFNDGMNKIMRGSLEPGCSIGYHCHETSSEIIYILSGEAFILYDDGEEHLKAGGCHYCPKGHSHSLINNNNTTLEFLAVVPEQ